MYHCATALIAGIVATLLVSGIAMSTPAEAANLSDADRDPLKTATAACKEEAKGMKFSWHWFKRRTYVKNCIITAVQADAKAANLSDADRDALKTATAACKEEAKGMKFSWHWLKRLTYVKNCIITAAQADATVDIWQIRRGVNMQLLRSQQPGEWGCDPTC